MTPDEMDFPPQPEDQPLDAPTVEGILGDAQPSGDADLDAVLSQLRALGAHPAPAPSDELAAVLGFGSLAAGGDELGRRRHARTRHIATGTTAVAGILLVTATAAAAIGTLRGERVPAQPTYPPTVVTHPHTTTSGATPLEPTEPRPASTTPSDLPVVPAADTIGATRSPSHPRVPHQGTEPSRHRDDEARAATGDDHGDEADDRTTDGRSDDTADDEPTSSGHDAGEPSGTGTTGDDDGSSGGHDGDRDGSGGGSGDGGGGTSGDSSSEGSGDASGTGSDSGSGHGGGSGSDSGSGSVSGSGSAVDSASSTG